MTSGTMRQRRRRGNAVFEILIVVAIIALLNLLSLRFFTRADLSEGKLFSVSESTKQVVRDLDDIVNIKVYFSKALPPYLTTHIREIKDLLSEYRAYGGRNVVVVWEDPADDPEMAQRVQGMGIPPVQLNIVAKDKAEVMTVYLGMAVLFEDRQEVIPVVQSSANLEYELTSAILKVSNKEQKTIGFLTGHGEPDINEGLETVRKALEKQYVVRPVEIVPGAALPVDVNTLVIVGSTGITDWDRFAIDQFVMKGGQVFFLLNRVDVPEGSLTAAPAETGLETLLAHYGAMLNPDMVVDVSCGNATFSTGYMRYTLPYPLWPKVVKTGFDKDSPITNQLEQAVFPWTSSIDITRGEDAFTEKVVLARSTERAWSELGQFDLNPQRQFIPLSTPGERNLAVLLGGSFDSYFSGREIPVHADTAGMWQGEPVLKSPETRIVVIGNARMIGSDFIAQYPENRIFFMNIVDWLTLGESLIGIRSRTVTSRPLKEVGEGGKATIRFLCTFGIPIILIIWGLLRRYTRRSRGCGLPDAGGTPG